MSTPEPSAVREWRDVSATTFRDQIFPANQPALIRGAVRLWPAVAAGRESPAAMANYLRGFDIGASADTMHGDASIGGRFFYNDQLSGLNFERRSERITASVDRLLELAEMPAAPSLYVGAAPMPASLPGFARDNILDLLDPSVIARLWLSNRVTVQTHYDLSHNIMCVVAGRRTVTLFPPEQIANLYVGPLEFTLAGQPISMVRLDQPDHERFPRFRTALAAAQYAELEPGDALYIPYMWWHHVEVRDAFSAMVNYWWDDTPPWNGSPYRSAMPRDHVRAFPAASQARHLAEDIRTPRVRIQRRSGRASAAAAARHTGTARSTRLGAHPRVAHAGSVAPSVDAMV